MSPDPKTLTATHGGDVTQLLARWREGDSSALEALTELVYEQLRVMARKQLARERRALTLQPTALVHELYLRLDRDNPVALVNRQHFLSIAARIMRRVLVDAARERAAVKRGANAQPVTLDAEALAANSVVDALELGLCLEKLATLDPRQAEVVELRYFAGLSFGEVADQVGISVATAKREWSTARAWLWDQLQGVQRVDT